jgi:putative flippase GtrA
MTSEPKLSQRLIYFLGIGITSACVHILIVLSLVTFLQWHPLIANIIAFLTAFNISYLGHKHLTFARLQDQKQLSLVHFFFVASSTGILNEFFYFLLLRYTHLNYLTALILILGIVAIYSFVLSRFWACR